MTLCINIKQEKGMKILVLALMLWTTSAVAKINYARGEWGSGGGNALVCFAEVTEVTNGEVRVRDLVAEVRANNNTIPDELLQWISSIELFDLYEAKKRRGLDSKKPEIIEIKSNEKIYEYFDRLGKRFEKNVYVMKNFITIGKELIPDTNLIFHESAVKYQNDLGSVTLPGPNCLISTMAAQVNFKDYFEVHIDQRLFNHPKHSKQSKATLILHELIYALGRKHLNHKDSGATRNVVRYYISYHESFTEGVVAKALHDLGFFKKDSETPEIMAKYHYSKIMSTIALELESFNDYVITSFNDEYEQYLTQQLRDQVIAQFTKEGFGDPSHYQADFFGLVELIDDGYRKSNDKKVWADFSTTYYDIIQEFQKRVDDDVNYYRTSILSTLDTRTQITSEDRRNAVGHLEFFFDEYEITNGIMLFKDIYDARKEYKGAMEDIYKNFIYYSQCRASSDSQPTPIPSDKENEECFEPLKLDNIIPRQ
jgi:hypothetical protein